MKFRWVGLLTLSVVLMVSTFTLAADKAEVDKERQEIRKRSAQILSQLYKANPKAKTNIEKSAGYATFSNFGMKILVAGSGSGKGVAIDNKTKKEVFMKMLEVQAGLGFGVKKFSLIWVFETQAALKAFIDSGWELGGQGSAAVKAGEKGAAFQDALAIAPGVWLYQLTDKGVALELTAKGTKYYKDDDLNG